MDGAQPVIARTAAMAIHAGAGLCFHRGATVFGERDDEAVLGGACRMFGARAVASLASRGGRIAGQCDLHAERVSGVGEVLAFLRVTSSADLLAYRLGIKGLRVIRDARMGEAGNRAVERCLLGR